MENKTAKHTPGPWHINGSAIEAHFSSLESGSKVVELVASVYSDDDAPPTGAPEANANLIAAAPELLRQVKRLHQTFGTTHTGSELCVTCAVIAKAEGR